MKISHKILLSTGMAVLATSALAYNPNAMPGGAPSQGLFANVSGLYSTGVVEKNATLAITPYNPMKLGQEWGFSGELGYEGRMGHGGNMLYTVAGGFRQIGKLQFTQVAGGTTPSDLSLNVGTLLAGVGVQADRIDFMAKAGAAVELGKTDQPSDIASTVYRLKTQVAPMAGAELGYRLTRNLKLTVQGDYIFGHKIKSDNIGTGGATTASGAYSAMSVLAGITFYMN